MSAPQTPLKTLIVPAEIKARELDSRILMGVLGAQQGWRVIIGSKSPLNRRVWKYRGDVYICQTLTKRRENNLRLFGKLGLKKIGWDEEGLVYYGKDIYLSRRVSQKSLARLDGLVAWGETSKNDLEEKAALLGVDVNALGNPRMDLLRPELRALYQKEADEITAQYGEFVLINTNFPSVNPHETVGDARTKVIRADKQASSTAGERFSDMQLHRKKILDHFFKTLPRLAKQYPHINFVIRPHPAESLVPWRSVCEKQDNLVISQKGPVIPWLIAAKGLIHNGCTTGIEYFLLGSSPIAFCPAGHMKDESPLPNGVSHHALGEKDLFALTDKSIKGSLKPENEHKQLMDEYLSARNGPMASERILAYCDRVFADDARVHKKGWSYFLTALYCALRQLHRSTRAGDPARDYIEKVFPRTHLEDVKARAQEMSSRLKLTTPVEVRECAVNIFEIRPADMEP